MAVKAKFKLDLNDDDIKTFMAMFGKYSQELNKSNSLWNKLSNSAASLKSSNYEAAAASDAYSQSIDNTLNKTRQFESSVKKSSDLFVSIAKDTRKISENLARSVISLVSISTLMGAVGGLLGIGGFFGLEQYASDVTKRRRTALGLGISYGQYSAFDIGYGRYGDAAGLLASTATGTYDFTSPAYIGLLSAGVLPQQGNAASSSIELLKKLPSIFAGVPDNMIGPMASALHITDMMSVRDIIAWIHMSDVERNKRVGQMQTDVPALNLSAKSQLAWANLGNTFSASGQKIETIFADQMQGLAEPLGHLSDSFVHVIDAFSKSKFVDDALTSVNNGLLSFSKKIDSPEFQQAGRQFISGLKVMTEMAAKGVFKVAEYAYYGYKAFSSYADEAYDRALKETPIETFRRTIAPIPESKSFIFPQGSTPAFPLPWSTTFPVGKLAPTSPTEKNVWNGWGLFSDKNQKTIQNYMGTSPDLEDPSILSRQHPQQQSFLNQYQGLRNPKNIEIINNTYNGATIVSSNLAIG